jgi:hypothetical protein
MTQAVVRQVPPPHRAAGGPVRVEQSAGGVEHQHALRERLEHGAGERWDDRSEGSDVRTHTRYPMRTDDHQERFHREATRQVLRVASTSELPS